MPIPQFRPEGPRKQFGGGIDKLVQNLIQIDQRRRMESQSQERIDLQKKRDEEMALIRQAQEARAVEQAAIDKDELKEESRSQSNQEQLLLSAILDGMKPQPEKEPAQLGNVSVTEAPDAEGKMVKTTKTDIPITEGSPFTFTTKDGQEISLPGVSQRRDEALDFLKKKIGIERERKPEQSPL